MKMLEIGAFEAKTRFSELLRGVQRGISYRIVLRGHPVARLESERAGDASAQVDRLLDHVQKIRGKAGVAVADILSWRDEGRR